MEEPTNYESEDSSGEELTEEATANSARPRAVSSVPRSRQRAYSAPETYDPTSAFAENVFGFSHNSERHKLNRRMERASVLLLISLGIIAGLVNGFIIYSYSQLCHLQAKLITTYGQSYSPTLLYYLATTTGLVFLTAFLCKTFAPGAIGSGLPEFKSLLTKADLKPSDYEKLVSFKILFTKVVGLILSVGCSLSVGTEGPLVHVAACIAHLLMKTIYEFEIILDSPNIVKQILAASAAIGISSAFNAPVGGLLFSVEATTTFYLISNYWKSCIAAATGAAVNYLVFAEEDPLLLLKMATANTSKYEKWELFLFIAMVRGACYRPSWLNNKLVV